MRSRLLVSAQVFDSDAVEKGVWGRGGSSSPRWVAALFKRSAARERTAAFALALAVWRLDLDLWTRGHGRCP